jgi:TolB protein
VLDDARRAERVTFTGNYNARPRLSPDGRSLALVTLDRGAYRVGLLDLQNRALRVLTGGREDESPSFAPNGATLIYATQEGRRGTLATASSDGRFQQRLSADQGDLREPAWSPYPPR